MLKLCSTHVLFMFISCSVHVYFMYKPGSSHVQVKFKVFKSCSSPVQILFTLLSNNFQVMCKLCSSHIQVMFNLCQVQVMFKSLARYAHQYQFGCGILKMVGPKKQDFWPKINILKGNQCILRIRGASVR